MEMRRSIFALGLVVAGASAVAAGWFAARSLDGTSPARGQVLATLDLPQLDGGRGGPGRTDTELVVLDFWASWCSPCHVQSRLLGQLVEEYEGRVSFYAVNVGEGEAVVRASLDEHPIDFPVLLDETGEVALRAEVFGLPTLVVLDQERAVALSQVGLMSPNALRARLDELLGVPATATAR